MKFFTLTLIILFTNTAQASSWLTSVSCAPSIEAPYLGNQSVPYIAETLEAYINNSELESTYDDCFFNLNLVKDVDSQVGSELYKDLMKILKPSQTFSVLCETHSAGSSILTLVYKENGKIYSRKGTILTSDWSTQFFDQTSCQLN